jgi:hypothetical protein
MQHFKNVTLSWGGQFIVLFFVFRSKWSRQPEIVLSKISAIT